MGYSWKPVSKFRNFEYLAAFLCYTERRRNKKPILEHVCHGILVGTHSNLLCLYFDFICRITHTMPCVLHPFLCSSRDLPWNSLLLSSRLSPDMIKYNRIMFIWLFFNCNMQERMLGWHYRMKFPSPHERISTFNNFWDSIEVSDYDHMVYLSLFHSCSNIWLTNGYKIIPLGLSRHT